MGEKRKTRQEQAAERAEILENMTEAEKELFRKRKEFISFQKDWRDYFAAISGNEAKEMVTAIFDYDMTGKTPKFTNKALEPVFKAMIKPVLDRGFNDWCFSCFMNANKGGKGGVMKAIRKLAVEMLIKRTKTDNINGIKYADLIKNVGWDKLREQGLEDKELSNLRLAIDNAYEAAKQQYYNEN